MISVKKTFWPDGFRNGQNARFQRQGFTLAELLIVIVILGILGGLALPRFFPQAEKGRAAEAIAMLTAIRQGEEAYRLEQGVYLAASTTDAAWESLGMNNPNTGDRNFSYVVENITSGPPPTFIAKATRCGDTSSLTGTGTCRNKDATYSAKYIQLNELGNWSGDHPSVPS